MFWVFAMAFLSAGAVDLINLKLTFSEPTWNEILKMDHNTPGGVVVERATEDKALKLLSNQSMSTQHFSYHGGKIKYSFDVRQSAIVHGGADWKVGIFQVNFYNGNDYLGHTDIYTSAEASQWHNVSGEIASINAAVNNFKVTFSNWGTEGWLEVDNITLQVEVPFKNLCGDQSFMGTPGLDHWFPYKEGADWDNVPWLSPEGKVSYVEAVFPGPGKALELENNSAIRTAIYPYDGEEVIIGAWYRQKGIKIGSKGWASAGIQVMYLDKDGEHIGHSDLITLQPGDKPWAYAQTRIKGLAREIKYLAVVPRIFDGNEGQVWVAEVVAVKMNAAMRKAYDTSEATVKVNFNDLAQKPLKPIWNGTDLSYVSQAAETRAKMALSGMRKAGVEHLRTREFMQGVRLVKGWQEDGEPILDFDYVDQIMDYLVKELGYKMTLTIETTPESIAPKKDAHFCNRYTPTDLNKWGRVLELLTRHWIERYGKDTVGEWTFECWNEPSASSFFKGTEAEFMTIFKTYVEVLSKVRKDTGAPFKIATASDVSRTKWYKSAFDQQRELGNLNEVDVMSTHIYAGYVSSFDHFKDVLVWSNELRDRYKELQDSELIITEYNGETMSNPLLDQPITGSYNIKAVREFLDNRVDQAYYFSVIDFMYGKDQKRHFSGGLGAYTQTGVAKPVMNSFLLMNELSGGQRAALVSSNDPVDGFAVLAEDGTLRILLTTFAEADLRSYAPIRVKLEIEAAGLGNQVVIKTLEFNDKASNTYAKAQELAQTQDPTTKEFVDQVNEALVLDSGVIDNYELKDGKLYLDFEMPLNSGRLLIIEKK